MHQIRSKPWQEKVRYIAGVAAEHDCALRVGVNCGSVDPDKKEGFDPADSIWTGPAEPNPRTEQATVTFQPSHATTAPRVCVYIE